MDAASRRFTNNPSFSSTLLDEIYRSIDQQPPVCRETIRKNQNKFTVSNSTSCCFEDDDYDERRASLIQKWMESRKPVGGRRSAADLDVRLERERESFWLNSTSSSCDSSCGGGGGGGGGRDREGGGGGGGGFYSCDGESLYGVPVKPRPIRTGDEFVKREKQIMQRHEDSQAKSNFMKTKSKALKIYSELKKVKQPVSPGGRLASFLNSLFTSGNNKKPTATTTNTTAAGGYTEAGRSRLDRKSKSANASTCSSASSFSRSCLSNTPSSRGKSSTGVGKRSVRFYPVSVIVDEDCQPCGHKSLQTEETNLNKIKLDRNSIKKEVEFEKNSRISEAARNLLKNYQKKVESEFGLNNHEEDECESDSSSDLFELDNLSAIGMCKYREELPVYETTNLDTNQAIANGVFR